MFRRAALALTLIAAGCGSKKSEGALPPDAAPLAPVATTTPDVVPATVEPPPYGPEVKSLRLKRSIAVRFEPYMKAKPLGTVAQDTRVGFTRAAATPSEKECARWIEIQPRGWVCDKYLEPDLKRAPAGVELPKLKEGEIVPGVYGRVAAEGARAYKNEKDLRAGKLGRRLAGMVTVRRNAELVVNGKKYWKTQSGELIEAAKIKIHEASQFSGVRPGEGAPELPLAWAQSRRNQKAQIAVWDAAEKGKQIKKIAARTVVPVLEEIGTRARVGEGEWIDLADLHVARVTAPPPTTQDGEKWLDVDTDEQVVVAYEGTRPVFATLVSTGNKKWPTAPGVYRIWIKFAETDMSGQMGDEQPYSVATVPWTMFFAKDLAFHTAYWHDRFGEARSHGCVNLSPRDARTLYFWADPDVPLGWSMSHGIVERPGSMVRIRNKATPDPEFQGYAKRVLAARGGIPAAPEPPAVAAPDAAPGEEPVDRSVTGTPPPAPATP